MVKYFLLFSIVSIVFLSACASPTATITTTIILAPGGSTVTEPPITTPASTSTPTLTATYTLPTTPSTPVQPQVIPDSGYIKVDGEGSFDLQRVYGYLSEPTYFEGVIFAPYKERPGVTTTGPLAYKIDVQFADGTVEVLQWVGLGNTKGLDINLTQHEHPKAGVLLSWQDVNGGMQEVLYLLVSEQ